MPTSFRLLRECERLWRGQAGKLTVFEGDAGVVVGRAEQIEIVGVADTEAHL
jgi:hypothetical protein